MHVSRSLIAPLAAAAIVTAVLVSTPLPASAAGGSSIAALAAANVGKKACSTNSRGGHAYYSSCTGNGGQPEYWCADFARWVWAESGVADTSFLDAAAGSFYLYGLDFGTLIATPAVGDVAIFDYHGGGAADHVAVVTQVKADGTIETISGDWNGEAGSEAHFSSTSQVVDNTPAYIGAIGTSPGVMGMTISAFVAPVGVTVQPVIGATSMPAGQNLLAGQRLTSPDGLSALVMQSDGNLVEYSGGRVLWSTGTQKYPGDHAAMQADGNFVIYSASRVAVWSSRTGGHTGAFSLVLANDAELAVTGPSGVLWSEHPNTSVLPSGQSLVFGQRLIAGNGFYQLALQSGGNLVETTGGRDLWSSGSAGRPGDRAVMQSDGNLVLYSSTNAALWSSHTGGHTGSFSLVLANYGDLAVYGPSGVLWSNHI